MNRYLTQRNNEIDTRFQKQLRTCRTAFEKAKMIAPNLVMITLHGKRIPCYLDQLDNGMELMFFPDETSFSRSILNAMNDDPDLLFTDAWTIDFLYKPCGDSDLYVSDDKNLCFRNLPGYLPKCIDENDKNFLLECLEQITYVLVHERIPMLADEKMGMICNSSYTIEDFCVNENLYSLALKKKDVQSIAGLPHTNEHIAIFMVALANADSDFTKQLHIRLVAQSKHDNKELDITLNSMFQLSDQLYPFLMELFQEHGIPEAFQFNNINIAHLFSDVCQTLQIESIIGKPQCDFSEATIEMVLQAFERNIEKDTSYQKASNPVQAFQTIFREEPYAYQLETKRKILN